MTWQEHRDTIIPAKSRMARQALAKRYDEITVFRPELGRLVGPTGRTETLHQIVSYKEAFSPQLVRILLDELGPIDGPILDPFCGAGTTLLVAAERGLSATGVDILPFSAFASRTLLGSPTADWNKVRRMANRIVRESAADTTPFPDFPVRSWAFGPVALGELQRLNAGIDRCRQGVERDVLKLTLLSVVEQMSQATRDGTSLRKRPHGHRRGGRFGARRTRQHVREAFTERLNVFAQGATDHRQPAPGTQVLVGDARNLSQACQPDLFGAAVFSPPYPNRYDYVGNYQLELGFGFVADRTALQELRRNQLRSHLEAPWPAERTVKIDALDEFLAAFLHSNTNGQRNRVFKMVVGYFEDMSAVFEDLRIVLRPGAPAAVVVGTQSYAGESLPTDLLLTEIAASYGFDVEQIWVARHKGIAVQQRANATELTASSRESLVMLRKRPLTTAGESAPIAM